MLVNEHCCCNQLSDPGAAGLRRGAKAVSACGHAHPRCPPEPQHACMEAPASILATHHVARAPLNPRLRPRPCCPAGDHGHSHGSSFQDHRRRVSAAAPGALAASSLALSLSPFFPMAATKTLAERRLVSSAFTRNSCRRRSVLCAQRKVSPAGESGDERLGTAQPPGSC